MAPNVGRDVGRDAGEVGAEICAAPSRPRASSRAAAGKTCPPARRLGAHLGGPRAMFQYCRRRPGLAEAACRPPGSPELNMGASRDSLPAPRRAELEAPTRPAPERRPNLADAKYWPSWWDHSPERRRAGPALARRQIKCKLALAAKSVPLSVSRRARARRRARPVGGRFLRSFDASRRAPAPPRRTEVCERPIEPGRKRASVSWPAR